MPGAMMNHFVLANWYEGENTEDQENIGYANAVKIMNAILVQLCQELSNLVKLVLFLMLAF